MAPPAAIDRSHTIVIEIQSLIIETNEVRTGMIMKTTGMTTAVTIAPDESAVTVQFATVSDSRPRLIVIGLPTTTDPLEVAIMAEVARAVAARSNVDHLAAGYESRFPSDDRYTTQDSTEAYSSTGDVAARTADQQGPPRRKARGSSEEETSWAAGGAADRDEEEGHSSVAAGTKSVEQ